MEASLGQRDIKQLYKPPPQQDYSDNYRRLVIVIIISFVFIAGQLVAGIYAHSIAIISDAIHLISDTIGFFFSFLFLYLSKKPPNPKMSFGYHRMQLLGAIANIFIIWILILFVVYESTIRIIDREFVEDPMIMLITAVAGFVVNVVMYKVLHRGKKHSHRLLADDKGQNPQQNGSLSTDKPVNKDKNHSKSQNKRKKHTQHARIKPNLQQNLIVNNYLEEQCDSSSLDEIHQLEQNVDNLLIKNTQTDSHRQNVQQQKEEYNADGGNRRTESIGMQAAVLHALSDLIMSIGLIISSLIIFFLGNPGKAYNQKVTEWNAWHLFDPIATYIFSIIALASTIPVIKDSYWLLMERTPDYIDLTLLQSQCQTLQGVTEIHDIHVWELKPGKACMMAHVLAKAGTERRVLMELSDIARKHRIFHSNFQVEEQKLKENQGYILCDNDIH